MISEIDAKLGYSDEEELLSCIQNKGWDWYIRISKSLLESTDCLVFLDQMTFLRSLEEFSDNVGEEYLKVAQTISENGVTVENLNSFFILEKARTKDRYSKELDKEAAL